MTLTPPVVNGARARLVLATGAAKRPVITRWLHGDRSLPIATVKRTATTVYLDPAAAPQRNSPSTKTLTRSRFLRWGSMAVIRIVVASPG